MFISLFIFLNLLLLYNISPIEKVLLLIILYLLGSLLIIQLNNIYIGLTYIIIYIGAIAILFLFVIMMLNIQYSYVGDDDGYNIFLLFKVAAIF